MNPTALIITLQMDPASAEHFTSLRQAHFPSARNWLSAHVTLFHALPLEAREEVLRDVAEIAARTGRFAMDVDRLLFLGRGVAFGITAPPAVVVRQELAARWAPLLSRQDGAWHGRLHITVQNKVEPSVARVLHAELQRGFEPRRITATGLQVWNYVGGPWEPVATLPFID
ncbi:2'-5' RNA ligase family protein [Variovorax sp. RHLX14]|uniref:2'-5' RNA ligase family protein n=1 Tax=Variovorax sp. RHLX14 TaxID=1259731 RepID=UPI003F48EA09